MGIPLIMLRDVSDLDGIFPSYIIGEMSKGLNIELDKGNMLCLVFNIDMRAGNYTQNHYH